jgi:hypothetical protein
MELTRGGWAIASRACPAQAGDRLSERIAAEFGCVGRANLIHSRR